MCGFLIGNMAFITGKTIIKFHYFISNKGGLGHSFVIEYLSSTAKQNSKIPKLRKMSIGGLLYTVE